MRDRGGGVSLPALWTMAGGLAEGYCGEVEDLRAAMLAGFAGALHWVDTGRPGISPRCGGLLTGRAVLVIQVVQAVVFITAMKVVLSTDMIAWFGVRTPR